MTKYSIGIWFDEIKDTAFELWISIISFFAPTGKCRIMKNINENVQLVTESAHKLFRIKHAERLKKSATSYTTQMESLLNMLYLREAKKFLDKRTRLERSQLERAIDVKVGIVEETFPSSITESDKDLLSFYDDMTISRGETKALYSQIQIDDFNRRILFNEFTLYGKKPYQIISFLRENRKNHYLGLISIFLNDLLDEIRKQNEDYSTE